MSVWDVVLTMRRQIIQEKKKLGKDIAKTKFHPTEKNSLLSWENSQSQQKNNQDQNKRHGEGAWGNNKQQKLIHSE